MPYRHKSAAARLYRSGSRLWISHQKNGTNTQYVAARKAFFPGVVCTRPYV